MSWIGTPLVFERVQVRELGRLPEGELTWTIPPGLTTVGCTFIIVPSGAEQATMACWFGWNWPLSVHVKELPWLF
jgi:hypothetical protein